MQAHGLDTGRLIDAGLPPISMREGARAMGHLLDTRPDTQAVIAVSDLSAFGALTECQRRGVDVPGRMSVAGFGDYDIGAVCVPTLTTINPFPREIGARAAAVILDRRGLGAGDPVTVAIRPELLLRGSSV
jgi:LacI family gluconate utilization system Gnt-I transcriptional repressor